MKASWNGRHSGGSTRSGSMPCSCARRWRAAIAIARFASRKASNTTGSASAPVVDDVFDVLVLAGRDVMREPVEARRALLERKVLPKIAEPVR